MKKLIFLLTLFFSIKSFAVDPSVTEIRTLYQDAAKHESSCKKLLSVLNSYTEKNNTLLAGYKAAATMMMAKYCFSPFSKISYYNKGKNLLERSIEADKYNIELRFLRFAVQTNIPFFLAYKGAINSDKSFLIKHYYNIEDSQLKHWLVSFLKTSENLTAAEKQSLKE
ncbi:MAG: hypothetical protein ABIW34_07050 [Ginsengibacter sp.]